MSQELYEITRRELKPLVIKVLRFFNNWDQNLTKLSKKLMKVFQVENDYNVITKIGNLGLLEQEYYKKYVDTIIRKYLENFIRLLEDLHPEIDQFLVFTRKEVNSLNIMVKNLLKLVEKGKKVINFEYEDYFNVLHEYLLLVNNLIDSIVYDVVTKQNILDELTSKFLMRESKNLELLRVYMICLQNHSLGADINILIETLEFGHQIINFQPDQLVEGEYHNRFLQLTAKIVF
ncbi:MAG: hypothetical protein HeimC3_04200 [Candidatus Heimdallarchaeota archaeon LC_3]|nr:MAG: hypothetical protein HeimC3_04200 [Candidatus Heimdallarchaeota archaeon LC_3]